MTRQNTPGELEILRAKIEDLEAENSSLKIRIFEADGKTDDGTGNGVQGQPLPTDVGSGEIREEYQSILDAIRDAVFIEQDAGLKSVNPAATVLTGYSKEELISKPLSFFVHSEDRQKVETVRASFANDQPVDSISHFRIAAKSGEAKWVESRSSALTWQGRRAVIWTIREDTLQLGKPECRVSEQNELLHGVRAAGNEQGVFRCVGAAAIHKEGPSEDELIEHVAMLETILEKAADGICVCYNIDERPYVMFTCWNQRMREITGYTLEEINALGWYKSLCPDRNTGRPGIERMARMGAGQEIRAEEWVILSRDGTEKPLSISTSVIEKADGKPHILAIMQDISKHKQAEDRLKKSEESFRALSEATFEAIFLSEQGICIGQNLAAERMFGYSTEEALGRSGTEWIDPDYRDLVLNNMLAGYEFPYEAVALRKDGSQFPCEIRGKMMDYGGRRIRVTALRDITDRKEAEEALKTSEERFEALIETMNEAFGIQDETGTITYVNNRQCEMLGYTRKELIGRRFADFFDDESKLSLKRQFEKRKEGQASSYEVTFIRKDGKRVNAIIFGTPIFDREGNFKGSFGVGTDITYRKKSEQAIRSIVEGVAGEIGEKFFESCVMHFARILEADFTLIGEIREGDQGPFVRSIAFCVDGVIQANINYLLKGSPCEEVLKQEICAYPTGVAELFPEDAGLNKRNVEGYVGVGLYDSQRRPMGIMIAMYRNPIEDVDFASSVLRIFAARAASEIERKKAEAFLRESERRFRTAFHTSPDAVNINRLSDGMYVDVNLGFTELTGFTREDVIGKSSLDINIWHDPKDRERLVAGLKEQGFVRNMEARFRMKDGRVRTGLISARTIVLHGRPHILSVTRDVDDWKRAEEALLESERRYKDLFDNSTDLIYTHDVAGNFTSINEAVTRLLGYSPEECLKLNVKHLIHPDYLPPGQDTFDSKLARVVEKSGPYEIASRAKDGRLVWLEVTNRLIKLDGKTVGVHGTARDVTERKEADAERSRLVTAIEQAGETILVTDPTGKIIYVNPAFEVTTGYTREEAIGKNPRIWKSGHQDKAFYSHMWNTLLNGDVWRGRFVNRRKDGTLFEENATISPIRDETARIVNFVAVKRDITSELVLQKQLVQAQKMEAIGTLAGGMAHDFNNLLQAILGYSDLLLMRKARTDPEYQKVRIIRQAARDGADLVSRILTFSRRAESKPRPVDLNEEIRRAEKLLRRTVPKMIEIRLELADNLNIIDGDPGQMEQMLLNLAVNAQHAMPKGGLLLISTRNVSLTDENLLTHLGISLGRYVLVTVTDTGTGMEPEVVDRIFEPFFTTKNDLEGTGLGLAMVHGIVTQHGGHIRCYSEPGRGTTFKIYFPVSKTDPQEKLDETREMPAFGTETVLLVDDDDRVREMGRQMIEMGGYGVFSARNGEEALEIYAEHKEEISLIILDLIMPGMGGRRCLEELLAFDPEALVLIASGHSSTNLGREEREAGARGFINKPYDAKDILGAIRRVLDRGTL